MSCFAVKSASVRYNGHDALARADLVIQPGEAVGIVGPSGAGKTTLLRLLNAALRPASGAVEVDGVCLASLSNRELRAVRARIGFVHQDLSLVPNLRVVQNVVAGRIGRIGFLRSARSMIFPNKAEVSRVHRILERVGIPEKLFERTDSLSGGQRQRVAVARALYQEPQALLADEPVSSVDPARARDTIALLCEISREKGLTLCVSLHNLELAREFLPRLIGMRAGSIVFDRPTRELKDEDFRALYDLSPEEMLEDGTRA
ncbi:MAG: ATP-binding cassette domain-containing protein [Planctomycetota bacterium]|nr:ATP-binding cassette domain-containing protein [Planctomycetota bacterium]